MNARHGGRLAWGLAAFGVMLAAIGIALSLAAGSEEGGVAVSDVGLVSHVQRVAACLIFGALGILIARRNPHNAIGWIFCAVGLASGLGFLTFGYAELWLTEGAGPDALGEAAAVYHNASWVPEILPVTVLLLLFPDGRLLGSRWRFVGWCAVVGMLGVFVAEVLSPGRLDDFPAVENPYGAGKDVADSLGLFYLVLFAGILGSVASLVLRFRRAAHEQRQQIKWVALAGAVAGATVIVFASFYDVVSEEVANAAILLSVMALPVAAGIAILRHRLYDIDVVINRTLVYGVLTLLLAAAYGAATLLLGTALGSGSGWATAGATLLVAVVFRPLRARVQDGVDRRFARARYDAQRRITSFLEELRAGRAAPEEVEPLLREVLADPALELRFFLPESEEYVDARGRAVSDSAADGREQTPVSRGGQPLGLVLHTPVDTKAPAFLAQVVEAAGLAIEIARLRVELRRQLDEVEASRARVVLAEYEERRRIERDLHDGAQQRLVSIGLALRHAQHELGPGANGSIAVIDGAVDEIGVAIDELRELARGVRPAQLDDGLRPAFAELAARAPLPVEVSATAERFPADLEAVAYFIASEGITNAVKHAEASKVRLGVERTDGRLAVSVADDGVGGADPARGSGLRGLADRVAAHGGTLEVTSAASAGTTLRAELPCAS